LKIKKNGGKQVFQALEDSGRMLSNS